MCTHLLLEVCTDTSLRNLQRHQSEVLRCWTWPLTPSDSWFSWRHIVDPSGKNTAVFFRPQTDELMFGTLGFQSPVFHSWRKEQAGFAFFVYLPLFLNDLWHENKSAPWHQVLTRLWGCQMMTLMSQRLKLKVIQSDEVKLGQWVKP